jgi:hypothetical protein
MYSLPSAFAARFCASSLLPVRFLTTMTKEKTPSNDGVFSLEQVRGIEPLPLPWQGSVLPLNHTCPIIFILSEDSKFFKDNVENLPMSETLGRRSAVSAKNLVSERFFGASGQNRTDYACLFRATLYQ